MIHDVRTRIMYAIGVLFITVLFVASVEAVEELKVSQRNGGVQYWWEVEEFDERDDEVFFLNDEKGHLVDDLKGASGDAYLVHNSPNPPNNLPPAEDVFFAKYTIDGIASAGTYFVWARASWDRNPSGRAHNSFFVQVNGTPDLGKFERHINTLGDATWLDKWDDKNPWTWVGDSAQPQDLQGQAGGGLQNGLETRLDAGENTVVIYHREGGLNAQTMCSDVLMVSTVDFIPTDDDFAQASPLPVQPKNKLTTTWARMKTGN